MSVALELEYEASFPGLRLVPAPGPAPSRPVRRHRLGPVLIALVALGLLVLLALPISGLGGRSVAGSAPTAGQEYVVRSGDTLTSIAQRVGGGNVAGMVRRLSAEAGSSTIVPGEHLLIP